MIEFTGVIVPFAQGEEGIIGRMFPKLMGVGVYAVFEGPGRDAYCGNEKRGQVCLGFFVVDGEEQMFHK